MRMKLDDAVWIQVHLGRPATRAADMVGYDVSEDLRRKNSDHFEVAMTSNIVLMYWVVRDGHDHYSRIFTYIEDFWHRSICMSRVLTCLNIPFEHPGRPVDAKVFLGEAGRLRWNMMDLQDHLEHLVERPRRQAAHTCSNMHVQLIHSQKRLL